MHPLSGKEKKPTHISQHISLAIPAFIALVSLIIILVTQNYANDSMVTILLFVIALILILGFFGNSIDHSSRNYISTRRYNKLAKSHFKIFSAIVSQFEEFTINRMDNIQIAISDIKQTDDFSQINVIDQRFIQNYYNYYKKGLNQFDGTKDSLIALARDFESVLDLYDTVYINKPIKAIKHIGGDKVPPRYKTSYNQARVKYIDFINDYRKFALRTNKDFKDEEMSPAFGNGFIIREFFEIPEEL